MTYDPQIHHRRSIRLANYDYSLPNAYFVTVCVQGKRCIFGRVGAVVGAIHESPKKMNCRRSQTYVKLNRFGRIVDDCINDLPLRYPGTSIDCYVVMPNHVHFVIIFKRTNDAIESDIGGSKTDIGGNGRAIRESPLRGRSLLSQVVGYLKMNAAKRINQIRNTPAHHLWQRNYYEHVIRDHDDMVRVREYIRINPRDWQADELYVSTDEEPQAD